jgi:hypothetical protein
MQAEKATSDRELADPAAWGDSPEPADDGLPLHATASTVMAATAKMTIAVRAVFMVIVCSDRVVRALGSSGLARRP